MKKIWREKKKKILIKKLITIENNQRDFLEKEKQQYESIKERRYEYFKTCRNNKKIFDKNFTDDARGIIDYQHCVLSRQKEIEEKNKLKRENCMEKTIYNQMQFEQLYQELILQQKELQPFLHCNYPFQTTLAQHFLQAYQCEHGYQ